MQAVRLGEWFDGRQRGGRYSFTASELANEMSDSRTALRQGLLRLQRKNRVRRLRRDFYVILPVEYSQLGMIPADWFIDDLMRYLEQPYYVALFSAAALHGAVHQQVQTFQIMTSVIERPIKIAGLNLYFFQKEEVSHTATDLIKGHAGMFPVSTMAATALDLIAYANRIGGLDAIFTPLQELCEEMQVEDLIDSVQAVSNRSLLQRFGWLLDRMGRQTLADSLQTSARESLVRASRVPLDPAGPRQGSCANRWNIIENAEPEGDL